MHFLFVFNTRSFFLFLRQRDKIPYPINTDMRDCWPVFQVVNKEKTLGPRLLALHFPVVLWYKWSRQAHHLSLTNVLPAKTIKVKWLGFSGSKKWNSILPSPRNQGLSRAKAKTRNFPILDVFLGGGGGGGGGMKPHKGQNAPFSHEGRWV